MANNAEMLCLTDLHTHILPGVDDGAKDLDRSLEILLAEKASGVERVMLTPHFYPLRQEPEAFLERRQMAYEQLLSAWDEGTMPQLQLGAEVHYSTGLAEMDLRTLTLGQGNYLLLELSDTMLPSHVEQILKIMQEQSITPILAHVERCSYFRDEPARLIKLIEKGALAQISGLALIRNKTDKFAAICLQKNVAQFIASDVHGVGKGKACLGEFVEKLDRETVAQAEAYARAVWNNKAIPAVIPTPIKRKLFGYA